MTESQTIEWKESWGRGIDLIHNTCIEQNYPAPRFSYDHNGLWVEFTFPEVLAEADGGLGASQKTSVKTTQETTQEKIIILLRNEPSITRKELAKRIGLSTDGIKYHLEKMKSSGHIRHVGPTKAGHWEVLK